MPTLLRSLPPWLGRPSMIFWGVLLVSLWPLYSFQDALQELRAQRTAEQALRFLPSGKFLRPAVLGYDNLTADLLWIRGIALFGDSYRRSNDDGWFQWLFQLADLATELDPRDFRIYKYAGIMLRLAPTHIEQSTYLFHKGIVHCPDEFFLPFGIAMNYLEFKNMPDRAAEYMKQASQVSNAPFYLRNLAARMLTENDRGEAAVVFLEEQLSTLTPGTLAYNAAKIKLDEVHHDNGARALRLALNEFLSRFNRIPQPLEEMKGVTFFGSWPEDPFGGRYVLEPGSGVIRSSEYARVRQEHREKYGLGAELKVSHP